MKKILTSILFLSVSVILFAQKDSSSNINGMFKKASSLFGKKSTSNSLLHQACQVVKSFQD